MKLLKRHRIILYSKTEWLLCGKLRLLWLVYPLVGFFLKITETDCPILSGIPPGTCNTVDEIMYARWMLLVFAPLINPSYLWNRANKIQVFSRLHSHRNTELLRKIMIECGWNACVYVTVITTLLSEKLNFLSLVHSFILIFLFVILCTIVMFCLFLLFSIPFAYVSLVLGIGCGCQLTFHAKVTPILNPTIWAMNCRSSDYCLNAPPWFYYAFEIILTGCVLMYVLNQMYRYMKG